MHILSTVLDVWCFIKKQLMYRKNNVFSIPLMFLKLEDVHVSNKEFSVNLYTVLCRSVFHWKE